MEKKILKVQVKDIVPYYNNPRKNDVAVSAVTESIRQVGYDNPIIVDESMTVLAGHTRLKSLKKLGVKEAEVLQVTGLTDEQKKKYRLLDNKAGEYARWDFVGLIDELQDLDFGSLDINWLDTVNGGYTEPEKEKESSSEEKGEEYQCQFCGHVFRA